MSNELFLSMSLHSTQHFVLEKSDEISKGNPGIVVGGGVIRDHRGSLIAVYAGKMGIQTNHYVEALAAVWGLRIAQSHNIQSIILEGDSLNIINHLNQSSPPSWNIKDFIMESISIFQTFKNIRIKHTYREGNKVVDELDNYGINNNLIIWDNVNHIPEKVQSNI